MSTVHLSEAQLREFASQGKNWVQVANETGANIQMIRQAASLLGIKSTYVCGSRKNSSPEMLAAARSIVERLADGATLEEIATSEGITRQAIYLRLKRRAMPTTCRAAVRWLKAQRSAA